jgi:hypothetical protein
MSDIFRHMSQSKSALGLSMLLPDLVWWTRGHGPPGSFALVTLFIPSMTYFTCVHPVCRWVKVQTCHTPLLSEENTCQNKTALVAKKGTPPNDYIVRSLEMISTYYWIGQILRYNSPECMSQKT